MRPVLIEAIIGAVMISTFPLGLSAQSDRSNLLEHPSLQACQAIEDRQARYACYDRAEASADEAEHSTVDAPASETRTDLSQSGETAVSASDSDRSEMDRFGEERPARSRIEQLNDGSRELFSTITELQERVPGRWLITLENGQVWYQTNSKRLRLQPGMEIRIFASPMGGSFRLSASEIRGFIQVERIR